MMLSLQLSVQIPSNIGNGHTVIVFISQSHEECSDYIS